MTPAPDDVADRLNPMKITAGLAAHFDEQLLDEMRAGRLRWELESFDSHCLSDVLVFDVDGKVRAGCTVHWSVVVD